MYLPSHGWKAVVLAGTPSTYPQHMTIDDGLPFPDDAPIYRAPVLRPMDALTGWIKSVLSLSRRKSDSEESHTTNGRPAGNHVAASKKPPFYKRIWTSTRELLFETPDTEVGWFVPAVYRGVGVCRKHKVDVVYSTGPPHSSHMIGVVLKRFTGTRLVLDFRDPWARVPWSDGEGPSLRKRLIGWIESFCVHRADRVILNTGRLCTEFRSYYAKLPEGRFVAITNGFDRELTNRVGKLLAAERPSGPLVFLHPGAVYGNRDLRPILTALAGTDSDAILKQVGVVEDPGAIREYARNLSMEDRLDLEPQRQPHATILSAMAAADVLVVLQQGTALQIPSKLFEMLLFRKPILALADGGATSDLIQQLGIGVVADPSDEAAIRKAVQDVLEHRAEDHAWDEAGRKFDGET